MATNHKDLNVFEVGICTNVNTANVTTPTAAELISAFGAAANNRGLVMIQDDNNADTTVRLIVCNGTSYYFVGLTKAT